MRNLQRVGRSFQNRWSGGVWLTWSASWRSWQASSSFLILAPARPSRSRQPAGTSLGYNPTALTSGIRTQQSQVGTSNTLNSVSCPPTSFCAAAGNGGTVRTSTSPSSATVWTAPTATATTANLTSIVCPSAIACYAVGAGGVAIDAQSDLNGTWTAWTTGTANDLAGIACPSSCRVVGAAGTILTNSRPEAPSSVREQHGVVRRRAV